MDIVAQTSEYFRETLGVSIDPEEWDRTGKLQPFLKGMYSFYRARFRDINILFMIDTDHEEKTPAAVEKHIKAVRKGREISPVYVRAKITAYNRKRLVAHNIPFIVPFNQMYLPMLAIDFREQFRTLLKKPVLFSPASQILVLHILLEGAFEKSFTPGEMAKRLGYTSMTMTRAFNEVESVGLGEVEKKGRERHLLIKGYPLQIWNKAKQYLRNPLKSTVFVEAESKGFFKYRAGLSALASCSDLGYPENPVFAVGRNEWKEIQKREQVSENPLREHESLEIQIWDYSPDTLSDTDIVDSLSLILTLQNDPSERVQMALDQLMEGLLKW